MTAGRRLAAGPQALIRPAGPNDDAVLATSPPGRTCGRAPRARLRLPAHLARHRNATAAGDPAGRRDRRCASRFGFIREPDRDDEVLPGLLLRAFALDLPEGRQVTVTELMQHFRQGLVALLPVANDLLIPWRQGEAYDQWDGMAAALFEALVKESAEETLSSLTFPARLRAADYDMDQIAASERWEIEVVDVREPSRILGIFHSLTTLNEPFDAVHVVDSLLLSVRTLSGDRPMAQVNFSFAAVVNGRRVVVDKVTL